MKVLTLYGKIQEVLNRQKESGRLMFFKNQLQSMDLLTEQILEVVSEFYNMPKPGGDEHRQVFCRHEPPNVEVKFDGPAPEESGAKYQRAIDRAAEYIAKKLDKKILDKLIETPCNPGAIMDNCTKSATEITHKDDDAKESPVESLRVKIVEAFVGAFQDYLDRYPARVEFTHALNNAELVGFMCVHNIASKAAEVIMDMHKPEPLKADRPACTVKELFEHSHEIHEAVKSIQGILPVVGMKDRSCEQLIQMWLSNILLDIAKMEQRIKNA